MQHKSQAPYFWKGSLLLLFLNNIFIRGWWDKRTASLHSKLIIEKKWCSTGSLDWKSPLFSFAFLLIYATSLWTNTNHSDVKIYITTACGSGGGIRREKKREEAAKRSPCQQTVFQKAVMQSRREQDFESLNASLVHSAHCTKVQCTSSWPSNSVIHRCHRRAIVANEKHL